MIVGEEIEAFFLLGSLPSSWDTFHIAISNSALGRVLNFDDVIGSLLAKEIRKKSIDHGKQDVASNVDHGKRQFKGKSHDRGKSHSKSCSHRDIKCHHCGKKGHIERDCYAWKREQRENKKDANKNEDRPKDIETGNAK